MVKKIKIAQDFKMIWSCSSAVHFQSETADKKTVALGGKIFSMTLSMTGKMYIFRCILGLPVSVALYSRALWL